jgi:hypothetical protein
MSKLFKKPSSNAIKPKESKLEENPSNSLLAELPQETQQKLKKIWLDRQLEPKGNLKVKIIVTVTEGIKDEKKDLDIEFNGIWTSYDNENFQEQQIKVQNTRDTFTSFKSWLNNCVNSIDTKKYTFKLKKSEYNIWDHVQVYVKPTINKEEFQWANLGKVVPSDFKSNYQMIEIKSKLKKETKNTTTREKKRGRNPSPPRAPNIDEKKDDTSFNLPNSEPPKILRPVPVEKKDTISDISQIQQEFYARNYPLFVIQNLCEFPVDHYAWFRVFQLLQEIKTFEQQSNPNLYVHLPPKINQSTSEPLPSSVSEIETDPKSLKPFQYSASEELSPKTTLGSDSTKNSCSSSSESMKNFNDQEMEEDEGTFETEVFE